MPDMARIRGVYRACVQRKGCRCQGLQRSLCPFRALCLGLVPGTPGESQRKSFRRMPGLRGLRYKQIWRIGILLDVGERETFSNIHLESGSDLLSRAVSSQVPSARGGLTSVFGMGTGGTLQP